MTGSVVRVVFLISVSLFLEKSAGRVQPLDMAENSVDDSYEGCEKNMNKSVISKFLAQDGKRLRGFTTAWENARGKCPKDGLLPNQCAAIRMYTGSRGSGTDYSYERFNEATREGAAAYRKGDFKFYTLHFFLTDAIKQLKKKQKKYFTTYRRTKVNFDKKVLKNLIRFGSFTSTSLKQNLIGFGKTSCFEIRTRFGADVTEYSAFKDEQEVLIPPYEKFKVTAIIEKPEKIKDCNVVYKLESAGKLSNLRCFNRSSSATLPSVLLPVLLLALFLV